MIFNDKNDACIVEAYSFASIEHKRRNTYPKYVLIKL